MEFNVKDFTTKLKDKLYQYMPYESSIQEERKHKNRRGHFRDLGFKNNPTIPLGTNSYYFELGNQLVEEKYPQYHILEDAEVIYKRGKGTETSKGSQASITNLGSRDYGIANIRVAKNKKGKTVSILTQEYRKNVRGQRSRANKATRYITDYNGRLYQINRNSRYYKNEHYHYIEEILDGKYDILSDIAREFNLKRKRTQISSSIADNDVVNNDTIYENDIEEMYSL